MYFFGGFAIVAGVLASFGVTGWWLYCRKKKLSQLTTISVTLCVLLTLAGAGFQAGDLGLLITSALVFLFSTWVLAIAILSGHEDPMVRARQNFVWVTMGVQVVLALTFYSAIPGFLVVPWLNPLARIILSLLIIWQGVGMLIYFLPWKQSDFTRKNISLALYLFLFVAPGALFVLLAPAIQNSLVADF
ncbi:hypothetical protein GC174_12050 [bacterium]|nr:hypothetical protein [bacterium]